MQSIHSREYNCSLSRREGEIAVVATAKEQKNTTLEKQGRSELSNDQIVVRLTSKNSLDVNCCDLPSYPLAGLERV